MVVRPVAANASQNLLSAIANAIRECLVETATKKRTYLPDAMVNLIVATKNVPVLKKGLFAMKSFAPMGETVSVRISEPLISWPKWIFVKKVHRKV